MTLWIVTRKKSKDASVPDLDPGEDMEDPRFFEFRVRQLNMEGDLSARLAKVVDRAIQGAKKLEPYAFEGAVENRTAMVESLKATGFSAIQDLIATAGPKDVVTEEKHLHLAYGYVLHAQPASGPSVYAFRRLQRSWKVNTVSGVINALFKKKY